MKDLSLVNSIEPKMSDREPTSLTPECDGSWTCSRMELRGWLARNAPPLADLYSGAVMLLHDQRFPGRFRFIAHAVREIRNRLPDAISGRTSSGRFNWKDRLDALAENWARYKLPFDGALPGLTFIGAAEPDSSGPGQASLPVPVVRQMATLLGDHREAREKPREAAMRLFEACAPENCQLRDSLRPVVDQWFNVTEWFVSKAHSPGVAGASHDEASLRYHFELFERTLNALVGRFFATAADLDEILEEANS
jgi:hypothetical protein